MSAQIKLRVGTRSSNELEFLPAALEVLETPPRPLARMTALAISAFFVIALVWSIVGHLDTVAIAQGQLVTTDRVKLIQSIDNGIVRAIHVRDGQSVRAGDVLIELDPTDAQANAETLKSDLVKAQLDVAVTTAMLSEEAETAFVVPAGASGLLVEAARSQLLGEVEKLDASLAMMAADIDEQRAAMEAYQTQLQKAKDLTPLIDERLHGLEELNAQNLVRKPELFATRQQKVENTSEISAARSGIKQAEARIGSRTSRLDEIKTTYRADALQRRAEALRKVASLDQQLRKEERRQADRALRAPVDGIVIGLSVFTLGGVVSTKDVVMRIVPDGSSLEAEVVVLNQDIGFVQKGQDVEIKLETFPFTRYGMIEGKVKEVWRDAIQDDKKGLVYKAELTLKQNRILVGDRWVPVTPGMAMQAEIKTGSRRVIDYFLSPFLRYRDESLRER